MISIHENVNVDEIDIERVAAHKWRLRWDGRLDAKINGRLTLLHRFILNAKPGEVIDHIDRNPTNNTRANLRFCTQQQNSLNQAGKPNHRACSFKGVVKRRNRYEAVIVNKTAVQGNCYIGSFTTEREAAIAYDIAARRLHLQFARLNIPDASSDEVERITRIIESDKPNRSWTTSRYIGVDFQKRMGKWRARIGQKSLGYFMSEEAAREARLKALHD